MTPVTVDQLRAALDGLPGDTPVLVAFDSGFAIRAAEAVEPWSVAPPYAASLGLASQTVALVVECR